MHKTCLLPNRKTPSLLLIMSFKSSFFWRVESLEIYNIATRSCHVHNGHTWPVTELPGRVHGLPTAHAPSSHVPTPDVPFLPSVKTLYLNICPMPIHFCFHSSRTTPTSLFASLKEKNFLCQWELLGPEPFLIFLTRSTLEHVQSR